MSKQLLNGKEAQVYSQSKTQQSQPDQNCGVKCLSHDAIGYK